MLPSDEDKKIFYSLQALKSKPIALVVNKIDNDKEEERAWEFSEFGAENLFSISVSHNRGVNALLNWLARYLPKENSEISIEDEDDFELDMQILLQKEEELENKIEDDSEINVAIIGRVNVGKSSLLNSLVNEDKAVVSSIAGTTIDPVDESIIYKIGL